MKTLTAWFSLWLAASWLAMPSAAADATNAARALTASRAPEKIFREPIHPVLGLQPFQSRKIAKALGLSGVQIGAAAKPTRRMTGMSMTSSPMKAI